MRVALVHDWLVGHRGGEEVLRHVAQIFADAPIYTLVAQPSALHPELRRRHIITSFIQKLPGAPARFRHYLPLFPAAIASFDLATYDLVVSTSHCVAHGVCIAPSQKHIAYVHTPMRYLYDQMPAYLPARGRAVWGSAARLLSAPLRVWDKRRARVPRHTLANSHYVAARILRVWQVEAEVLYPPVDVRYFAGVHRAVAAAPTVCAAAPKRHGLLAVGALVPYKRVDLAVALANALRLPLTVVGDGPERTRLRRLAGPTVHFVPQLSRAALRAAYGGAEALVFCGDEDFGIVPVEAMAAGCPILARRTGGLAETVAICGDAAAGVLFDGSGVAVMAQAYRTLTRRVAQGSLSSRSLLRRAAVFDAAVFVRGFERIVRRTLGA